VICRPNFVFGCLDLPRHRLRRPTHPQSCGAGLEGGRRPFDPLTSLDDLGLPSDVVQEPIMGL